MKVFRLNECDWWMAPTMKEAIKAAEEMNGRGTVENPRELTDEELGSLHFTDRDVEPEQKRTFREELNLRILAGAKTELFASTEY